MRGLIACSVCEERPEGKLSQVTWAWNPAPKERVAYRQRLCLTCFVRYVVGLDKPIDATGPLLCPACGIKSDDDMFPVYMTAYIPGTGKMRLDLALCSACSYKVQANAQVGAKLLEERGIEESRGLAPGLTDIKDPWAALGITARE